jgi:hypothetical protein
MTNRSSKTDPYCAFRDDGKRLLALVARDVRIALTAYACLLLGNGTSWAAVARWLGLG